jgi:hypothetical protein
MRRTYSMKEFAQLRQQMAELPPGVMLFVDDVTLEPAQLREIEEDSMFIVICGYENNDVHRFYCIARHADRAAAIAKVVELVKHMGGTNITQHSVS